MHYPDRRMSVLCVTGNGRPQFIPEKTASLLPSPDCQSVQLPPSGRRCGNNHLSKRQAYRECLIPNGLLLYPTPDLSKVCSHSAFGHPDGDPEISHRLTRRAWLSGKLLLANKTTGQICGVQDSTSSLPPRLPQSMFIACFHVGVP